MPKSKFAAEPNPPFKPFNPQRHAHRLRKTKTDKASRQTICNDLCRLNLSGHIVLSFQEFLFDQETIRAYNLAMASVIRQRSQEELRRALDELRNSEKKLRQVIDTIPTLAWCNLPDGSNEFLNKRWHEYTGLSPEESHGWGWQTAIHPKDQAPLTEKWRGVLAQGSPAKWKRVSDGMTGRFAGFS